ILLITHELDVIKAVCHDVALMEHGRIIESASVVDFFSEPRTKSGRELVERSLKMHLPPDLKHELSDTQSQDKCFPIVRLVFRGQLVKEAVMSQASRKYNVDISVLQSNIEFIGHHVIGFLVAEIRGENKAISAVLQYFSAKQLDFQVVGYVA
ncbi:MAG TPA: NIL domain-containing protein, partial [Myxococcota bacterium]|nr:NIL domain-containing protein [Myxococcota bacterium]